MRQKGNLIIANHGSIEAIPMMAVSSTGRLQDAIDGNPRLDVYH